MSTAQESSLSDRDLVPERVIDAPPEKLFRAWTEPDLLKQCFTPKPRTVSNAVLDVLPGGTSLVVMRSPEGQEFPNRGIYLEVVKNKRLVFTDADVNAWTPSEKPFMTATITFFAGDMGTRYTARVLHWSVADRIEHETMGFHQGWSPATNQLIALVATDVTRVEYTNCADDADVVLYTIQGGGHSWPGGKPIPEWMVGYTSNGIDATSTIWTFFHGHRLSGK